MAKNAAQEGGSYHVKLALLSVLVIQNAVLILSMRYSRVLDGPQYITTTAVVISEFTKMTMCLIIIRFQHNSTFEYLDFLHDAIIVNWQDTLKLSIPAMVYALQNNLQYVAVSNLEAAVFQVLYQMKVFTTALFSVVLLSKSLSMIKWASLVLLFIGVSLVTVDPSSSFTKVGDSSNQSFIIGILAVVVSCLSSGFAGVYFEKILKGTKGSIWLRNVQLGFFGFITAIVGMLMHDYNAIKENGFFVGYSGLVVAVILQQALGGLVVAAVVRYADNILKGFATSLSIIISAVCSVYLFGFVLTVQFGFGTVFVVIAIYMYGLPNKTAEKEPPRAALPTTKSPS